METVHAAHLAPYLSALCGTGAPATLLGIAAALFAAGLIGSFAHCAPMCGPFVLMQIAEPQGDGLVMRRLAAGALPLYQLGRLTTYVGLGVASGGFGSVLTSLAPVRFVAASLLALAALSFLLQAIGGAGRFFPALEGGLGARYAALAAPLLRRMQGHPGLGGYRLGLVLGFLPCGFLYGALIAAAASGGALAGGIAMAAFALGTIPALAAIGMAGSGLARRWRPLAAAAATPIFLLNAVTLGGLAIRLAA